ncbi:hypothetical protein THAOC_03739, partial [Thalassiosira oceanica]
QVAAESASTNYSRPPSYQPPPYRPPSLKPPPYRPPSLKPPSYDPTSYAGVVSRNSYPCGESVNQAGASTNYSRPSSYKPPPYQPPSFKPPSNAVAAESVSTNYSLPPSYQRPSYQPPSNAGDSLSPTFAHALQVSPKKYSSSQSVSQLARNKRSSSQSISQATGIPSPQRRISRTNLFGQACNVSNTTRNLQPHEQYHGTHGHDGHIPPHHGYDKNFHGRTQGRESYHIAGNETHSVYPCSEPGPLAIPTANNAGNHVLSLSLLLVSKTSNNV